MTEFLNNPRHHQVRIIVLNFIISLTLIFGVSPPIHAQDTEPEDYRLMVRWLEWSDGPGMLTRYLNRQAFEILDRRDDEVTRLETEAQWTERTERVRGAMMQHTGPFPEKTPLNARITGTIRQEGYKIEKVVFESMPGYHVTGMMVIPEGLREKRPGILYVCGHSGEGFRSVVYQNMAYNLALNGFVVFAIDPIGQGERLQYYDPEIKRSVVGGPTSEHSFVGNQCFLLGTSVNKYFIWDGIRAIDYLQSREEVDPQRIGITGRSGGGTQSAFIGAVDERVTASAPENYITSHRRLLQSRGPQDGEQNFYHWLSDGWSIEDLLYLRMPRPTMVVATTRDIFSIQGVREACEEINKGWEAFGKEKDFILVEDHHVHGTTLKNRKAVYGFFHQYLSLPGDATDHEAEILDQEELWVTETGQVSTSLKGESTFSLNAKDAEVLYQDIVKSRQHPDIHLATVKESARRLSGYQAPAPNNDEVYRGSYQKDGYTIGMHALETDGGYVVPMLLAVPDGEGPFPAVICIHPEGKEAVIRPDQEETARGSGSRSGTGPGKATALPGGLVENLVKKGFIVALPDLIGTGETDAALRHPAAASYGALIIGRSMPGIHAADIVRVGDILRKMPIVKASAIRAIAFGELCPALLHAGVFDPGIHSLALIDAPVSYYNITQTRIYGLSLSFNWGVAGALSAYDLPDLAACIAPRKLALINLRDAENKLAGKALIEDQMKIARDVYGESKPGNLDILSKETEGLFSILSDWLLN